MLKPVVSSLQSFVMTTTLVPKTIVLLENVFMNQFQFHQQQTCAKSLLVTPRTEFIHMLRIVMTTMHAPLILVTKQLEIVFTMVSIVMTKTLVPPTLAQTETVFTLLSFVLISILAPKILVTINWVVSTLQSMIAKLLDNKINVTFILVTF